MLIHSYIVYDKEWPDNPDKFLRVIHEISQKLKIESFKIEYLEIYKSPITYHKDQVLCEDELQELFGKIWNGEYWAYMVAHQLSFCMYEDNIRISCPLTIKEVSDIVGKYDLCVEKRRITDNPIRKWCSLRSIITPKRIKIKDINKPPLEGYGASPVLLPPESVKEYELDKVPFRNACDDWAFYEDIGLDFNGVILTEKEYLDMVNKVVDCIGEITACLGLDSFRIIGYHSLDQEPRPKPSRKKMDRCEMFEFLRFGIICGDEFAIKANKFILYSKFGFTLGINTILPYDEMEQIATKHGLFLTVMWKEWEKRQLFK